jgi:hypothetical protein
MSCFARLENHTCKEPTTCPCDAEHVPIDTQQVAYDTSRESAARTRVTALQELLDMYPEGTTVDEFRLRTGIWQTTASGEFTNMRKDQLIESIGTRMTSHNRPANVWVLTDLGLTVARNLNGNGSGP